VTVLNETSIEGVAEQPPLCDVVLTDGTVCGFPAARRVLSRCDSCKKKTTGFACEPCWAYVSPALLKQDWLCRYCLSRKVTVTEL
jgi:hypothetical protein